MPPRRSGGRAVLAASGSLSIAVVPVFLVGALSGRIGDDLGFGAGQTGVIVALFFSAAGLAAIPFGMVSDRIGARQGMRLGMTVSACAAMTVAFWVDSVWQLALAMAIGGSVVGLIDTGGARLLSDAVRRGRQGVAFGIKEASVPAASMLAGGSIPVVAERFGWRPMFVTGALLAPLLFIVLPAPAAGPDVVGTSEPSDSEASPHTSTVLLAGGVAVAVGAATASATFLVPAATASGLSGDVSGVILAAASVASMVSRVVFGTMGDRRPESTATVMVAAMALGAVGAGVLALEAGRLSTVVGALLLLGAGWGWTGLAFLIAVRATPDAPSTAAGVVLTGLGAGGVGGPIAYGATVSLVSYRAAWILVVAAMLLGAALTRLATRR